MTPLIGGSLEHLGYDAGLLAAAARRAHSAARVG